MAEKLPWRWAWLLLLFLATLLLLFFTTLVHAVSVEDDQGKQITLDQPPNRIVALAPFLTELVFSLEAGDFIVGVSDYSDYPPAAASIPRISRAGRIDMEALLNLRPQLVLVWTSGYGAPVVEQLRALGLPVYASDPENIRDVASTLLRLGKLLGKPDQGRSLADSLLAEVKVLRARYAGQREMTVFWQVWSQPLMTLGGGHAVTGMLADCGARNVFGNVPDKAFAVDPEAVIARRPQIWVQSESEGSGGALQSSSLDAYSSGARVAVVRVDPDLVHRQSLRMLAGATQLCERIHQVREAEDKRASAQQR